MPNITIYKDALDTTGIVEESSKVVDMIRDGRWKSKVTQLNLLPKGSKQQEQMKKTLHGIAWQGTFSHRKHDALVCHSGLIACDFDHIPEDKWQEYREVLTKSPHTYALFQSPRREGLKAIFRIPPCDPERHREYARGLKSYFEGYECYDHYEDTSRLCFGSYDPDIYFNPDATEFTYLVPITKGSQGVEDEPVVIESEDDCNVIFRKCIYSAEVTRGLKYVNSNKHRYIISVLFSALKAGLPKKYIIDHLYNHCKQIKQADPVDKEDFITRANNVYDNHQDLMGKHPFRASTAPVTREETDDEPINPSFPIDALPMDVALLLKELNKSYNYSVDFMAVSALWAIATINGNKYKLRVKNEWIAPTIFWFACVGDSGTMKSHPMDSIIRTIKGIDKASKVAFDRNYEQWEIDDLSYNNHSKTRNPNKKPVFKQLIVGDFTLEALHVVHSNNRRGIGLYKDELKGFFNDMDKYRKGSDEQFWLESFNNKSYVVNRMRSDRPLMINDTMINILGAIQPDILMRLTRELSGNGMINRFLFTANETGIYPISRQDIDPAWMKWWDTRIRAFHDSIEYTDSEDTEILEMTHEAMDIFLQADKMFCELQRSDNETNAIKNYLSKMKTYLPRLALTLCIMDSVFEDGFLTVNSEHMERAKSLCEYFISSARLAFDDSEKRQEIQAVTNAMKSSTKTEKIIALFNKGYKQSDIAKELVTPKSYVSKICKELKEPEK